MIFGIKLEAREWIQIIAVVPTWIALIFIYRQLRTNGLLLRLNAMVTRHSVFNALHTCMSEDAEKTMLLHTADHFNPQIYRERYEGNPQAIQSYLLMKRKYLYLIFSLRLERNFRLFEKGIAAIWIEELARYQEFRDVHASQQHYYRQHLNLHAKIDAVIATVELKGWMYKAHLPPANRSDSPEKAPPK